MIYTVQTFFYSIYCIVQVCKNNNIAGDVINSVILSEIEWNNQIGRKEYF